MNNEVQMNYKGKPYSFDEVKKINLDSTEPYKKYTDNWGDHYSGIPKCHPLKLQGIISDILTENPEIKGIVEIGTMFGALSCYLGAECIERGFKPHFVPIEKFPKFEAWLRYKASPEVLKYALERGGLVVGKLSKWRRGIRFMESAFNLMNVRAQTIVTENIIQNLQRMKIR